jgi:hypothetical protein
MKRLIVGLATIVLPLGSVASVVGISAGSAQAKPGAVPLNAWPGCPNDHPAGPCHWCPEDPRCRPAIFVWTRYVGTRVSATPTGMSRLGRAMFLG